MKVFNLLVWWCLSTLGFAQTTEEIMDKVSKAMGEEAAKEVSSMYISGEATIPGGFTARMNIFSKDKGKLLVKTNVEAPGMKMEMIQGCDGTDCYSQDPNFGLRLLEGQEKEMMLVQNDFKGQLDWRSFFSTTEYKGEGEIDGRKVHKVYVETKAGMSMTNAYDAETFMLLHSEGSTETPMGKISFTMRFFDYEDVFKGLQMPRRTTMTMLNQAMEMKFTEIEANVSIPDSKFALPAGLK